MEIAASIQRDDVLVIPVLVAGADMPTREELPEPLQPSRRARPSSSATPGAASTSLAWRM